MTVHHLPLERATTHGPFDRDRPAVLEIESGDTVIFRTLDAGWGAGPKREGDMGRGFDVDEEDLRGHALCGPIHVRGAGAGDVLEVRIGTIVPSDGGITWAGPRPWLGEWERSIDRNVAVRWGIDVESGTAHDLNGLGVTLPIRPFMGVLGNVPAEPGRHLTSPPRRVGGNLDCKELVPGSILWLPIEVDGALFSVGDGHAVQGDGEVSGTAIECPMEHVELTLAVRNDLSFAAPRAETPAGYLTFGLRPTLDEAMQMALGEMLNHMTATYGLPRPEALALASLVVDLRITQIVNGGTVGCHAVLPRGAFTIER